MGQFRAARFALCEPHISLFRAEVSAPFFALQFDGKSKFLQDGSPGLTREQDKFVSENASFGQNLGAQGRFFPTFSAMTLFAGPSSLQKVWGECEHMANDWAAEIIFQKS